MSFLINVRNTIASFGVVLFMIFGISAIAHAANITFVFENISSSIGNVYMTGQSCDGAMPYCSCEPGTHTTYECRCSGVTAGTNLIATVSGSSNYGSLINLTYEYGYCDDTGDIEIQENVYVNFTTNEIAKGRPNCSCGGSSGSGGSNDSGCAHFRTLWNYYLANGVTVSRVCSGDESWAANACGGTSTGCFAWYKGVDYTTYNLTINDLVCNQPDLSTEAAARELGLACDVVGPASGEIYILANCNSISETSTYYNLCDLERINSCGNNIAVKCNDIFGANGYHGGKIYINGNVYLVCFNNADGAACAELEQGCANAYQVTPRYDLTITDNPYTLTPGVVYQTENMEQLKCCRGFTSADNRSGIDDGKGVTCDYWYQCNTDGGKTVAYAKCYCSAGYYSKALYGYYTGDENDAYETMASVCDSCELTTTDSVNKIPTSNGQGRIGSCYLPTDTVGSDGTGDYEIINSPCYYSN